jgi:hypothetical protein
VSRYREQVASAIRAVSIRGSTRYAWLGRTSRPLSASLRAEMDASERRSYLVSCLREELYCSFYCHGRPVPARWGESEPTAADWWLAQAMSAANGGRGSWEPGWRVQRLEGEEAVVSSSRLRARVALSDCRAEPGPVRPGASVSLRLPKELPALSPGFYTAVANAVTDLAPATGLVRVYWNVTRAGAPELVRELTSMLNARGAGFRLKVADHAIRLDRCDAAVLYLPGEVFRSLREGLGEIGSALVACLRPDIPAFTLELVPGVGLAEDDGASESFGVRRCELVAEGIVRAHEQEIAGTGARLEAVAARLAEDGVRIDEPYLSPALAGRHVL